ncbi:MAG: RluA family pseudouridine synthase [Clostridia bacterium]|nr:RluA family pseudouridine synthase [Clostridia bacterium]
MVYYSYQKETERDMEIRITQDMAGKTVRDLLRTELRLSVKMLKYLKYRNAGICVNGERCTVRRVLVCGDVLTLETEDREASEALLPVDLPIDVLYEDEDLVVPAKPAQMPTHPSHDHYDDTVANALAFRYEQKGVPFVFRPINRLDRNTSGLLLVARNKIAAGALTQAMQAGLIRKSYLAILDGEMRERCGEIDLCLHRTRDSIIVREACPPSTPDADAAQTLYTVLASQNGHTLVCAKPITGRTHQLRVHFAALGHPITGDDLYGTPSPLIARHALHAWQLTFPHPATGEAMTLTAPLPQDLRVPMETLFPEFVLERKECL